MKVGRDDPCRCGSGKKYKKCCLAKDQEESTLRAAVDPPTSLVAPVRSVPFLAEQDVKPARTAAPARGAEAATPPPPSDPVTERGESRWREFKAQNDQGRITLFLDTLEDA